MKISYQFLFVNHKNLFNSGFIRKSKARLSAGLLIKSPVDNQLENYSNLNYNKNENEAIASSYLTNPLLTIN